MTLIVAAPRLVDGPAAMEVVAVHAAPGDALAPGAALIDLRLDLSAGVAHDCPPVSTYRIALAEPATVDALCVAKGEAIAPGMVLARLAATDGADRAARVSVAAILHFDDWWAG